VAGDVIELPGIVIETHRGDLCTVEVQVGATTRSVLARRGGRLVRNYIKLLAGDHVTVEVSPYDVSRGRVVQREERR